MVLVYSYGSPGGLARRCSNIVIRIKSPAVLERLVNPTRGKSPETLSTDAWRLITDYRTSYSIVSHDLLPRQTTPQSLEQSDHVERSALRVSLRLGIGGRYTPIIERQRPIKSDLLTLNIIVTNLM